MHWKVLLSLLKILALGLELAVLHSCVLRGIDLGLNGFNFSHDTMNRFPPNSVPGTMLYVSRENFLKMDSQSLLSSALTHNARKSLGVILLLGYYFREHQSTALRIDSLYALKC